MKPTPNRLITSTILTALLIGSAPAQAQAQATPTILPPVQDPTAFCARWLPSIEWAYNHAQVNTPFLHLQEMILADTYLTRAQQETNSLITAWVYANQTRRNQPLPLLQTNWLSECYSELTTPLERRP